MWRDPALTGIGLYALCDSYIDDMRCSARLRLTVVTPNVRNTYRNPLAA